MANLTSAINVKVDSITKQEATKILTDLGLSMSSAIEIFLKQVVKNDGLPFEVKNPKPSRKLRRALKEADDMIKNPDKYPVYDNVDELMMVLEDTEKYGNK